MLEVSDRIGGAGNYNDEGEGGPQGLDANKGSNRKINTKTAEKPAVGFAGPTPQMPTVNVNSLGGGEIAVPEMTAKISEVAGANDILSSLNKDESTGELSIDYEALLTSDYMKTQMMEGVHSLFDGLGTIPVGGEIFDGINASIYAAKGDYVNSAISLGAAVPFIGWSATGGKWAKKIPYIYKANEALVKAIKGAKRGANLIPTGKLGNHLFKGAGKLADNPVNRLLIENIANGKALGVDAYGKSWYMGLDGAGKSIYTYTQNGVVKGAGYATMTTEQMILKYGLK